MKRFGDVRVAARLAVGFATTGVLLIAVGGVALRGSQRQQDSLAKVTATEDLAKAALQLKFDSADLNGWQTAYALDVALGTAKATDDNGPSRAAFLASAEHFRNDVKALAAAGLSPAGAKQLDSVTASFEEFMRLDDDIISGYRSTRGDLRSAANAKVLGDEITIFTTISKNIDDFVALMAAGVDADVREGTDNGAQERVLIAGGVLVALALSITLGWLITRSITVPLERLRSRLAEIADGDGDLTARLDQDRQDELGRVAAAFNRFVDKIAHAIRTITDHAVVISSSSEELSAVSRQMASNAQHTTATAAESSTTAAEVSDSANTVAAATEEMTAVITEIARSATQAAQVASRAMEIAVGAQAVVQRLGSSSLQIDEVAKLIGGIADQTNLLALNATIEAARAGDAGRGFAVVANEVKELAHRSGNATADISQQVAVIQSDVSAAVAAIAEIVGVIDLINENQSTVAAAVQEQSATTDEISRNILHVANGATRITSDVATVAGAAREAAQGAGETEHAASELSRLSTDLRELVGHFKA